MGNRVLLRGGLGEGLWSKVESRGNGGEVTSLVGNEIALTREFGIADDVHYEGDNGETLACTGESQHGARGGLERDLPRRRA